MHLSRRASHARGRIRCPAPHIWAGRFVRVWRWGPRPELRRAARCRAGQRTLAIRFAARTGATSSSRELGVICTMRRRWSERDGVCSASQRTSATLHGCAAAPGGDFWTSAGMKAYNPEMGRSRNHGQLTHDGRLRRPESVQCVCVWWTLDPVHCTVIAPQGASRGERQVRRGCGVIFESPPFKCQAGHGQTIRKNRRKTCWQELYPPITFRKQKPDPPLLRAGTEAASDCLEAELNGRRVKDSALSCNALYTVPYNVLHATAPAGPGEPALEVACLRDQARSFRQAAATNNDRAR
ncbi:hypothetical protein C8Q79DRAFT_529867 [Trametes meyenii]|nr:hypothetical protein C8Q79DRAFT_529867 [Trametes meyenii]